MQHCSISGLAAKTHAVVRLYGMHRVIVVLNLNVDNADGRCSREIGRRRRRRRRQPQAAAAMAPFAAACAAQLHPKPGSRMSQRLFRLETAIECIR